MSRPPAFPDRGWYTLVILLLGTAPLPARAAAPPVLPEVRVATGDLTVDIAQWFQDAFPFNETPGLPGTAAFDTAAALVESGLNIAPLTGTVWRFDIPGDTIVANAAGADVRIDLVFRILPGPGDHVTKGVTASGLRRVPTAAARVTPGDGSWWGAYLADPGAFATPGAAALHAAWPGGWNPNVWMSARCDTAQANLFPIDARGLGPGAVPGLWMSAYHESDPHLAALGIARHRCFLVDTLGPADATNLTCSSVPAWVTEAPWRTGYDGQATTVEGTKILPDGLLTPGSHVEYFYRRSSASSPATMLAMCPDTDVVVPQPGEASLDGHRWQQFGVLPDLWKGGAYGGQGMACALVVDLADRRGDELAWVSIADSMGATSASKRGAHNGWSGPGGVDPNDPRYFVAAHGGNAGTTWDLYQVKAGEDPVRSSGGLGGRLAYRASSPADLLAGREARIAPTPEMVGVYYKAVMLLTGDLSASVLGAGPDVGSDDTVFLTSWLQAGSRSDPRGVLIFGDGFAESLAPAAFLTDILGMDLWDGDYRTFSGDTSAILDLHTSADLSPQGCVYGVRDPGSASLDVLIPNPLCPEASVLAEYPRTGADPMVAGVFKSSTATRPWLAATHGFGIQRLVSRFGDDTRGRAAYALGIMSRLFGGFCVAPPLPWWQEGCVLGAVPDDPGPPSSDFARLDNNPLRAGTASVEFGLTSPDRVEVRIYDVSGRLVRTLADRDFTAGAHRLAWDGHDAGGRTLARGVYFVRVRFARRAFESVKHAILLE